MLADFFARPCFAHDFQYCKVRSFQCEAQRTELDIPCRESYWRCLLCTENKLHIKFFCFKLDGTEKVLAQLRDAVSVKLCNLRPEEFTKGLRECAILFKIVLISIPKRAVCMDTMNNTIHQMKFVSVGS